MFFSFPEFITYLNQVVKNGRLVHGIYDLIGTKNIFLAFEVHAYQLGQVGCQ
jgi:hypothetical protein